MATDNKKSWKEKLKEELISYSLNVLYLAIFFFVFINYERLILAEYNLSNTEYGIALIKALVLGKVIMIGEMMHLGVRYKNSPLIYPTLYKAIIFTLWTIAFHAVECILRGLFGDEGILLELRSLLTPRSLAGTMVVFFVFIPFFALKELGEVYGSKRLTDLFFKKRNEV